MVSTCPHLQALHMQQMKGNAGKQGKNVKNFPEKQPNKKANLISSQWNVLLMVAALPV